MKELTFYNKNGNPTAYTQDGEHIYLFDGSPVGYLANDSVYSFNGVHLGRFKDYWIRDNSGNCVFFTEYSQGSGPIKPVKHIKPVKNVKRVKPIKSVKQVKPVTPLNSISWSNLSSEGFFYQ